MRNAFEDNAQTLAVLQDHLQKSGQGRQRGEGLESIISRANGWYGMAHPTPDPSLDPNQAGQGDTG